MTIRHLKIFLAVAEYKTMSAAAEKLYISQFRIYAQITITKLTPNKERLVLIDRFLLYFFRLPKISSYIL